MSRTFRTLLFACLPGLATISCANQAPRLYDFEDIEIFAAPFSEVWSVVHKHSQKRKWRIEKSEATATRAYLTTDWMTDDQKGGDYGSVGISLGKANQPLDSKTKEVAISIRIVSETKTTTRIKVTCLFRIQRSQRVRGSNQTMFGTSRGIVEQQILNTIRSKLATP